MSKMKKKKLPKFKSENEERNFWSTHSPLDYFDLDAAERAVFPNLKPTMKAISLRLPESMIEALKLLANKQDIAYQSLIKIMLAREIRQEQNHHLGRTKGKKKAA